jgi:hypothetical protein
MLVYSKVYQQLYAESKMTLMFREIDCHIILTRPAPEAKGRFTTKEPWNHKEDETEIATTKLKSKIMGLDPVLISANF